MRPSFLVGSLVLLTAIMSFGSEAGAEGKTGILKITTKPPGATVLVGGKPRGTTVAGEALAIEVPAGTRVLTFRLDGYADVNKSVLVYANIVLPLAITMEKTGKGGIRAIDAQKATAPAPKRWVTIKTRPLNLNLTLNNEKVKDSRGKEQKTPCSFNIEVGAYMVRIPFKNLVFKKDILVTPGKGPMVFEFDVAAFHRREQKKWGMLTLSTTPSSAGITIDSRSIREKTPATLALKRGKYKVTVQKQGYRPIEKNVRIRGLKTTVLKLNLERLMGDLVLSSDPSGAGTQLDGKPIALDTPLRLATGLHEVVFNKAGYQTLTGKVSVVQDRVVKASGVLSLVVPPVPTASSVGRKEKTLLPPPALLPPWTVETRKTGLATWIGLGLVAAGVGMTVAGAVIETDYASGLLMTGGMAAAGLGLGFTFAPMVFPYDHSVPDPVAARQNEEASTAHERRNSAIRKYNEGTARLLKQKVEERRQIIEKNKGRGRIVDPGSTGSSRVQPGRTLKKLGRGRAGSRNRDGVLRQVMGFSAQRQQPEARPAGAAARPLLARTNALPAPARDVAPPAVDRGDEKVRRLDKKDASRNRRRVVMLSSGLGLLLGAAACAATGAIYLAGSGTSRDSADTYYYNYENAGSQSEAVEAREGTEEFDKRAHDRSVVGPTLLVGAGIAAATGTVLLILAPKKINRSAEAPLARVNINPVRGGIVAGLGGRF